MSHVVISITVAAAPYNHWTVESASLASFEGDVYYIIFLKYKEHVIPLAEAWASYITRRFKLCLLDLT